MTMNWNTLDSTAYANQRWELLTQVEESGAPKLTPYLDSVGIPTIGVGFNIKDAAWSCPVFTDSFWIAD